MKTSSHRTPCLLMIALLTCVAPGAARAQEDFEHSIDTVRQLIASQEYEKALERLGQLKPLARDANERSAVSLYEGIALLNMERRTQDQALAAFREVLLRDPKANLPVKVPPRLERTFEEVRTRVRKELDELPPSEREGTAPPDPAPTAEPRAPSPAEPGHEQEVVSRGPGSVDMKPLRWLTDPSEAESFRYKASRPRVLVSAITGGALLASGGVFWGLARHEQSLLRKEDLSNKTLQEARGTAVRGQRYQTLGFSLAGAGGVALGVATILYLIQVPNEPVTPGSDGPVVLKGTWP